MRFIQIWIIMVASQLSTAQTGTESDGMDIVGRGAGGDVIVTFEGINRAGTGALGSVFLKFRNVSDSAVYELLMDERLSGRMALQLYDGENPINDPYLEIPSRMLGDISLDLTRMEPGDVFEYRMDVGEFSDRELYEHLDVVNIQFQMSIPIYHEGADTSRDEWIEIMHVLSTLRDLPVINGPANL